MIPSSPVAPERVEADDVTLRMPCVGGDEIDDGRYYIDGHVPAEYARVAFSLHLVDSGLGLTRDEVYAQAGGATIRHRWYRPVEDDDEPMVVCRPSEPGASPFTVIDSDAS